MKRSLITFVALVAFTPLLWACSSTATASQAAQTVLPATATPPVPSAMASEVPSATTQPSAMASSVGLAGQWSGTWTDTSPDTSSGSFSLTWTQTGSTLAGNITVKGTPCLSGGTVTGTINGSSISFGAVSGQVTVTYTGSFSSDSQMSGTYSTTSACANAKGNWQATKG